MNSLHEDKRKRKICWETGLGVITATHARRSVETEFYLVTAGHIGHTLAFRDNPLVKKYKSGRKHRQTDIHSYTEMAKKNVNFVKLQLPGLACCC